MLLSDSTKNPIKKRKPYATWFNQLSYVILVKSSIFPTGAQKMLLLQFKISTFLTRSFNNVSFNTLDSVSSEV